MKTIATNEKNDIFLDVSGNLAFKSGNEARANICTNRARSVFNEIPLDMQSGIPYFSVVFNNFDINQFKNFLFQELLQVSGVDKILSFSYNTQDNKLTYEATLQATEDGEKSEVIING